MQEIFNQISDDRNRFRLTKQTFITPVVRDKEIVFVLWYQAPITATPGGIEEQYTFRFIGSLEDSQVYLTDDRIMRHIETYQKDKWFDFLIRWLLRMDFTDEPAVFDHSIINLN